MPILREAPPKMFFESVLHETLGAVGAEHLDGAISLLEEALRKDPENADYLSKYGVCLAHQGVDPARAVDYCMRAVRLDPREVHYQINLGRAYRLVGDKSAAYQVFLQAWRRNRKHALPAAELARMGVRKSPVLPFLDRGHWCNVYLGRLREKIRRTLFMRVRPHGAF